MYKSNEYYTHYHMLQWVLNLSSVRKKTLLFTTVVLKTVLPIVLTELGIEIIKENREANKRK